MTAIAEGIVASSVLDLHGCRPAPLGSYLRALGVLRLVGEQADPAAAGWWEADVFHLRSTLDRAALTDFLLHQYRPTPVVAPWNKGSGFKVAGNPTAVDALARIESSVDPRLEPYRHAADAGRRVLADAGRHGWDKRTIVEACRARFADAAVVWVDATVVLAGDDNYFPPLLGTGGNDGRFDFSVAFMQRLADVLCLRQGRRAPTSERSEAWLGASLFGDKAAELMPEAVGQFDPGAAGGANSSPVGAAPSLVNPWSWVLLIEGALVFASAAARRLGAGAKGKASMPFTVNSSSVGYPSAATGEKSRGEIWAPLWERPATVAEIAHLVGEGRSEWHGRRAGTGLDMARATASLGVDRGINAFERHVLLERNGLATVAVPAGRLRVGYRSEVPVAGRLDPWLDRIRATADKPASVEAAVRVLDAAMYALAIRGGGEHLFDVLAAAASLEMAVGRSPQFRKRAGDQPLRGLRAAEWFGPLDLSTAEARLACGLASMRDGDGACLRLLLRPIVRNGRSLRWSSSPPPVAGFGVLPVVDVLAAAHVRRVIDLLAADRGRRLAESRGIQTERDDRPTVGVDTAYSFRLPVPAADIALLLADELDQQLLQRCLAALLLLDWDARVDATTWPHGDVATPPSPAWWLLAPFFCGRAIEHHRTQVRLVPQTSWPARLASGAVAGVLDEAVLRMEIARMKPPFAKSGASGIETIARCGPSGPVLAAALLCPISTGTAARLLDLVDPKPFRTDQEDAQ